MKKRAKRKIHNESFRFILKSKRKIDISKLYIFLKLNVCI